MTVSSGLKKHFDNEFKKRLSTMDWLSFVKNKLYQAVEASLWTSAEQQIRNYAYEILWIIVENPIDIVNDKRVKDIISDSTDAISSTIPNFWRDVLSFSS